MTIGYDEIEAALDELLGRLEEIGPPGPDAVSEWMREQGIDPAGVLEAVAYAIHPIPHRGRDGVDAGLHDRLDAGPAAGCLGAP